MCPLTSDIHHPHIASSPRSRREQRLEHHGPGVPEVTELIALLTSVGGGWAYPAVAFFAFLESAAFVGLVIPGETAMLLGGVLAATSQVSLFGMIAGGVTGAVLGDLAGYGLG